MRDAGLHRNAIYLVRPDEYVGLATATGESAALARYLEEHAVTGSRLSPPAAARYPS